MSDAPERIWIEDEFGDGHEDQWAYGCWDVRNIDGYEVEYLRAALAVRREADAYRAGLEAAAAFIECGCPNADAVVALGKPNCAERWNLCGQANCAALEAAAIRAMKDDTP
jgi:hypothetical protein